MPASVEAVRATSRARARALLFNLDEESAGVLGACFQFCQIPTEEARFTLNRYPPDTGPVSAVVVHVADPMAAKVMEWVREKHPSALIFAVCPDPSHAMRFARYAINRLIVEPINRFDVLRQVRETETLVKQQTRRYPRVPLVTEVELIHPRGTTRCMSQWISAGGMSLTVKGNFAVREPVKCRLALPSAPTIQLTGIVCWAVPDESLVGVRFDSDCKDREKARIWIDHYLGID